MTIHKEAALLHQEARSTTYFILRTVFILFPLLEGIESCFRETIGITARIWSCSTRTIMELINQEHRGAEDLTQDEEIWERCAREVGLEGEDLEKERKKRQEKLLERLRSDQTPQDCPERPEIMFEGLDSTWHILGRAGDNIFGTAPYRYAGEVQDYDRWKAQTIVHVTTMIYHRRDTEAKEAYRQAMKEVIELLQGAALQVVKEMKTAELMK